MSDLNKKILAVGLKGHPSEEDFKSINEKLKERFKHLDVLVYSNGSNNTSIKILTGRSTRLNKKQIERLLK